MRALCVIVGTSELKILPGEKLGLRSPWVQFCALFYFLIPLMLGRFLLIMGLLLTQGIENSGLEPMLFYPWLFV